MNILKLTILSAVLLFSNDKLAAWSEWEGNLDLSTVYCDIPSDDDYTIHEKVMRIQFNKNFLQNEKSVLEEVQRVFYKTPCDLLLEVSNNSYYYTDNTSVNTAISALLEDLALNMTNYTTGMGINLLELAIRSNSPIEVIEFLLSVRIWQDNQALQAFDPNHLRIAEVGWGTTGVTNMKIKTPLLAAIENKNQIIKNIKKKKYYGEDWIHLLDDFQNSTDIIELLINHGADPKKIKWSGWYNTLSLWGVWEPIKIPPKDPDQIPL